MNVRERLFAVAERAGADEARNLRGLLIHAQKGDTNAIAEVAKTIGATPQEVRALGVQAMEELRGRLRVQASVVQTNVNATVAAGATVRSHTLNRGLDPKLAQALGAAVGAGNVETDAARLAAAGDNTLGIKRNIVGIVRPSTADEVSAVLKLARAAGQPVHVVSRGQNCGYGNKAPVNDGALLIELTRMTKLGALDEKRGTITVEPGVTQEQLAQRLEGTAFMMDVTGAGKKSSLVGNVLDGGYGWSPLGDRKKHLAKLEAVLPDGTKLQTSDPKEAQKFVQSGLGIVTSIEFQLMKRPERIEAYVITVDDPAQIGEATKRLAELGITGKNGGIPHISNAAKTRRSTGGRGGGEDESWTIVGGLYGSRDEVRRIKDEMKLAMRGVGKVKAYNSTTVNLVERAARAASIVPAARELHAKVVGLKELFSILEGKPTDAFVARAVAGDDTGLMWVSQRVKPGTKEMADAVAIAERVCAKHGQEAPITIAMLDDGHAALLLGVHFDKNDKEETKRAQALYADVQQQMSAGGIKPYRMTVAGQAGMAPSDAALVDEKRRRDPNNLFQPGRYGLGGGPEQGAPSGLVEIDVDAGAQKKTTFVAGDAAGDAELRAGLALLTDRYADKGYVERSGQLELSEHQKQPGARILVARREGEVVGTISVLPDGARKLPADGIFAAELDGLRKQGRRLAEIGRFAVSDELSKLERPKASRALFRAVERVVKEGRPCDDIIVTVNPTHVEFYRKAMGFQVLAGPKALGTVGGAPAVLMRLPVGIAERAPPG